MAASELSLAIEKAALATGACIASFPLPTAPADA